MASLNNKPSYVHLDSTTCSTTNIAILSQLSHAFDWSKFTANTCADSGSLELTSLSALPNSSAYSVSRILAHAARPVLAPSAILSLQLRSIPHRW